MGGGGERMEMGICVPRSTDARFLYVCNRKFVYLLADGADESYRNECLRSDWLSDMFYFWFI
jgi:hypothetical protein